MSSEAPKCNDVFGKIYRGQIEDQVTFRSDLGLFVVLAQQQATEGHSLVIPEECAPMTHLSPEARRLVGIGRTATKFWLEAAFRPEYVGGLDAGNQVRHAHGHEAPVNNRDFFRVMGAPDPQPFPKIDEDRAQEIFAAATFHPEYAEAVEAELLRDNSVPPETMRQMAYDLAIPITPRAI